MLIERKKIIKDFFFRDIKTSFASGNTPFTTILFFLSIILIVPFAIGPDIKLLATVGTGVIWIAILLATLLSLDRIFRSDYEDGSLDIILTATDFPTLVLIIITKCFAHWISTVLPLIIVSPLSALLLQMTKTDIAVTVLTLLPGTFTIILIGAIGAAITVTLPHGNILLAIIILPFACPIVIFSISIIHTLSILAIFPLIPFLSLTALTIFFTIFGPVFTAVVLRNLSE